MPFADNKGTRIHYEVEGKGPPLLLHHGLTSSAWTWRSLGYVDALKNEYRLILMDARGHGESSKPREREAYAPSLMAGDVVAVLDGLRIRRAHYWGYSMGGRIGFVLATEHPDRFLSFVLGGVSPLFQPGERQDVDLSFEAMKKGGLDAYLAFVEKTSGALPPEDRARLLANDAQALIALRDASSNSPSLEARLPHIPVPCFLYVGDADPRFAGAQKAVKLIPGAEFLRLPGLNHRQAMRRPDLVLPRVKAFLGRVSANTR